MAPAKIGDLGGREAGAPLEPFADRGFELIKMAGVKTGRFRGLDGRENLRGLGPPGGVQSWRAQTNGFHFGDGFFVAGNDARFAVVEKAVVDDTEAGAGGRA